MVVLVFHVAAVDADFKRLRVISVVTLSVSFGSGRYC